MLRVAVRVRRDSSELVLAELLDLAPGGVEELDIDEDVVEYAVYGSLGELPALPALRAAAGGALVDVRTEEIPDDWPERWRRLHRPLVLDGRLAVRPPWEPPLLETPIEVVIEPGQAFGTGAHATTRLCLELMLELEPGGGFVDLGCGSGVLAIVGARLGWDPVLALDNDAAAVAAASSNASVNRVAVEVRRYDLRVDPLIAAPTVAANLIAPLLRTWVARLAERDPEPLRVIAGGVLVPETDRVREAFLDAGLREALRRSDGEWVALLFERSGQR